MIERFNDEVDAGYAFQLGQEIVRLQGQLARHSLDAGDPNADEDDRLHAEAERKKVAAALARISAERAHVLSGSN